ncbi:hypothetical protein V8C86DRAFT_402256 [Haematococcus lacustris]
MTTRPTGLLSWSVSGLQLLQGAHPDCGTARLRLPARAWAEAGITYHRPVCVTLQSGSGTWRIFCISALTQGLSAAVPALDPVVVLPPAGQLPSQLSVDWASGGISGTYVSIKPVDRVQNLQEALFSVPASLQHLPRLRLKLHQRLLVPSCFLHLGGSTWVQLVAVDGAACLPLPSSSSLCLLRITSATVITAAPPSASVPTPLLSHQQPAGPLQADSRDPAAATPHATQSAPPPPTPAASSPQPPAATVGASAANTATASAEEEEEEEEEEDKEDRESAGPGSGALRTPSGPRGKDRKGDQSQRTGQHQQGRTGQHQQGRTAQAEQLRLGRAAGIRGAPPPLPSHKPQGQQQGQGRTGSAPGPARGTQPGSSAQLPSALAQAPGQGRGKGRGGAGRAGAPTGSAARASQFHLLSLLDDPDA